MKRKNVLAATAMAALVFVTQISIADAQGAERGSISAATIDSIISKWPNRSKLGAKEMMVKYGMPQEVSADRLIWHKAGPYLRIMVTREEIPHDFPKPHMDFLEHTIEYNVPVDKVGPLIQFDGSSTINRTAGELSARCDLEGHNILTLNLDNDIVTGKKSVDQARTSFGENVVQDMKGMHPSYVEALQFKPSNKTARFPDTPVIPGSPVRSAQNNEGLSDAEILAFVIAVDDNEILANAEAQKKKISAPVMAYAKMLHQAHGNNAAAVMKLGQQIKVTPKDTVAVDALRVKGAGELAILVPLDGPEFQKAYLAAMVKGHQEALVMIDTKLIKNADNGDLKKTVS